VEETLDDESRVSFHLFFTPSDIAYVLAIIKNGQEMWDQAKNPSTSPKKKLRPLFSAGEGRKRESGISVWNKEGLEFYYMVEKNWREVYNDKAQFSVLRMMTMTKEGT
jgi:hypothetical protein